jgi:hypothetical protein
LAAGQAVTGRGEHVSHGRASALPCNARRSVNQPTLQDV